MITIVCILIFIVIITSVNKRRTIDDLMSQLENAINKHNINYNIELYPDYYRDVLINELSQNKLNDFHNKVGDIVIKIVWENNQDSESMSLEIEKNKNRIHSISQVQRIVPFQILSLICIVQHIFQVPDMHLL